jgi:hypothetical protein
MKNYVITFKYADATYLVRITARNMHLALLSVNDMQRQLCDGRPEYIDDEHRD